MADEESLDNNLVYMAEINFPLTRTIVNAFAWLSQNILGKLSVSMLNIWTKGSLMGTIQKCHPRLLHRMDSMGHYRTEYHNPAIEREYFDLLVKT